MPILEFSAIRLAVAIGIGLLIGSERERRKGSGLQRGAAGVRTFTLAAFAGALSSYLQSEALLVVVAAGAVGKHGAGSIITRPGTDKLYIRYYRDGKQIQEATGTTSREEAQRLLNIALGNVEQGTASPVGSKSLTYEALREAYIAEEPIRANYHGLKYLDEYFSGRTVKHINEGDHVEKFVAHRRRNNCTDPTIRRNLNPLKAMFRLAIKRKKIGANDVPYFPSLADSAAAGEYITPEQFAKILAALPTAASTKEYNRTHEKQRRFHDLRPLFTFIYSTGCRLGAAQRIS